MPVPLGELYRRWREGAPADGSGWPRRGVAIEGDFAGIQGFVLKPVPGAKGAAKRLRGRSMEVVAYTTLLAREVTRRLAGAGLFYTAGGRFLLHAEASEGWEAKLATLQREVDEWTLEQFRGQVVFHLAGAPFEDGRIPGARLGEAMWVRRNQALGTVLTGPDGWRTERMILDPGKEPFQCPACRDTASQGRAHPEEPDERICEQCWRDTALGGQLAALSRPGLVESERGHLSCLGRRYAMAERGELRLDAIHYMPQAGGEPLSLTEVAARVASGRHWLGYLRADADLVGDKFRQAAGDPGRVLALSQFLDGFFRGRVQEMLSGEHGDLYPVYGGGDDLFVIGPWDKALDFAAALAEDLRVLTRGGITFSAGLALAKPRQHILTKAREAEDALNVHAKGPRASLHALGQTMGWGEARAAIGEAKKALAWHTAKRLPSTFLRDILAIHEKTGDGPGYRPLLHYQARRNLRDPELLGWAERLRGADAWKRAPFVARYVMAGSGQGPDADEGRSDD